MAISGKTTPDEIPYLLSNDKPPDMAAVTKAQADRVQALLPSGTKSDGRIAIVDSGAAAYKAIKGDATLAKDGTLTIGPGIVDDGKLASPNSSLSKLLLHAQAAVGAELAAGTYLFGSNGGTLLTPIANGANLVVANGLAIALLNWIPSEHEVANKTTKLRIRGSMAMNATNNPMLYRLALYPLTVAGGAGELKINLGEKVANSEAEADGEEGKEKARKFKTQTEFTPPAEGIYALGLRTTAKIAAGSVALVDAYLTARNT